MSVKCTKSKTKLKNKFISILNPGHYIQMMKTLTQVLQVYITTHARGRETDRSEGTRLSLKSVFHNSVGVKSLSIQVVLSSLKHTIYQS